MPSVCKYTFPSNHPDVHSRTWKYGNNPLTPPFLLVILIRFEGMKAYRCEDGTIRLFRPDMNMHRMNRVGSSPHIASETLPKDADINFHLDLVFR